MKMSGQLHTPGKEPDAHWIGDWVGFRASLDFFDNNLLSLPAIESWFVQPVY